MGGIHLPKSLLFSPYPAIPPYVVRTPHPGTTDDREFITRRAQETLGNFRRTQDSPRELIKAQRGQESPGDPRGAPENPGEPRGAQESPGELRRAQASAGESRRMQESPRQLHRAQKSPENPRGAQDSPGELRRAQESPGEQESSGDSRKP